MTSNIPQVFSRLLFSTALLGLLALGVFPASAQSATAEIDQLDVALWPEFDRPSMLVIYRFEIAPDTTLPARVALPVPVAANQPHAVAWLGNDNVLYDAEFSSAVDGDWLIIEVAMPESRAGQLEFYADMDFASDIRSYLFEWPQGYELGELSYEVQEPVAATDLRVNPAPEATAPGAFGLNYVTASLGPQTVDDSPVISVTYQKATPTLSQDALQPLGQVTTPVAVEPDAPDLLPWLLLAAGIGIVGGGAYYVLSRRRPAVQRSSRTRRKRTSDVELEASTVYCHNCGTAAGISDVYCRQCGTQLRRS